jgi:hypothetical protein
MTAQKNVRPAFVTTAYRLPCGISLHRHPMVREKSATGPDTIEGILDKLDLVSEELTIIKLSLERTGKQKNVPGKRPSAAS